MAKSLVSCFFDSRAHNRWKYHYHSYGGRRQYAISVIKRSRVRPPDLSSKPAGHRCCCQLTGQTDGWTYGQTDRRSTVSYTLLRILCGQCQYIE